MRVFQPAILAKCLCARTGFSQPARKNWFYFMVRKMLVYSIRVFLLPYCKVEKKWHYIAWAIWTLHTVSAVLIAEAKLVANEG